MSVKLYSKEHSGNQFEMLRTKRVVSKNETFLCPFLRIPKSKFKGFREKFQSEF